MFKNYKNSSKAAFTLIELLVVVAIIGMLSGVILTSLNVARERARITAGKQFDANNLHSIGDQLVAEWKFDDSVNRYLDTSGSGRNGSCTGSSCPTVSAAGGFNGQDAMNFDGVNDFITVGVGTDYFPMTLFTLCAWVKTPGLASGMSRNGIFGITYGLSIFLDSSGRFNSYIDNSGSIVGMSVSGDLRDDKFHHLCVNFDGVKRNMYVDGNLKGSMNTTWSGVTNWPTHISRIGTELNNPSVSYFNGLIDDIRVYSSALNITQIEKLYAEGLKEIKLANMRLGVQPNFP